MTVFIFLLGIALCALLWFASRTGVRLMEQAAKDRKKANYEPPGGWPVCSLIIPVSGAHPLMEKALRSLLEQDYPCYRTVLVTLAGDSQALPIIETLVEEYPDAMHITAEAAENCGQKNQNILTGIAHSVSNATIYAFCDSTHLARQDFLRCLVFPLAMGTAAFSTGYHQVQPRDNSLVTLAYALSVLFMRLMQGMSVFTQPWGGALAMTKTALEQYRVRELWSKNVVDDCSLGALLRRDHARIQLCPAALLETPVKGHDLGSWLAWMKRQILFLKFCMPDQWVALGIFSILLLIPPAWAVCALAGGLLGLGSGTGPFLALCWLCALAWILSFWRDFLQEKPPIGRWLIAFFFSCLIFAMEFAHTIFASNITWRNIDYTVGAHGEVAGIRRNG